MEKQFTYFALEMKYDEPLTNEQRAQLEGLLAEVAEADRQDYREMLQACIA